MQEQGTITNYIDLLNEASLNKHFLNLQKKLDNLFESLDLEKKDIILAISWWADSMLVASLVLYYYSKNNLKLSNIHIAHCNHKIRKESETEAECMKKFFNWLDLHIFERELSLPNNENSLRNRRYSQFSSLQKSTKSSYIFVGHHLNDRIESTFLNLLRWSWINGFINMRTIEDHHLLPDWCKICRPLLGTTKSDILNICKTVWIPYFEDKTNFDNSISKRNYIRNQIINPLSKDSKFLESFSNIYTQIESFEKKWNINLINLPSFPAWNAEYSYLWCENILKCNENDLFEIFKYLRIQTSSQLVAEWKQWLNKWDNWYKYISWSYFFIHEKQLYIIKADKDFREKKIDKKSITIESMDNIEYYWFKLNIPRDELIWSIVRLPEQWDSFGWKKRSRWALNQKIPMWRRDWIPLAIKNGKVIHMWKNIWK